MKEKRKELEEEGWFLGEWGESNHNTLGINYFMTMFFSEERVEHICQKCGYQKATILRGADVDKYTCVKCKESIFKKKN